MTARAELQRAVEQDPRLRPPAETVRVRWAEIGIERLTVEMFGQLRDVPYDRLEPVARVSPPAAGEYVIGVDAEGYLARASFSVTWEGVPRDDRDERRMVDDLIRSRERVAMLEAALARRADFERARDEHRSLPHLLFTPGRKAREET